MILTTYYYTTSVMFVCRCRCMYRFRCVFIFLSLSFICPGSLVDPLNRIRNVIDYRRLNDVKLHFCFSFNFNFIIKSILLMSANQLKLLREFQFCFCINPIKTKMHCCTQTCKVKLMNHECGQKNLDLFLFRYKKNNHIFHGFSTNRSHDIRIKCRKFVCSCANALLLLLLLWFMLTFFYLNNVNISYCKIEEEKNVLQLGRTQNK